MARGSSGIWEWPTPLHPATPGKIRFFFVSNQLRHPVKVAAMGQP